jgi:hypothetical protein
MHSDEMIIDEEKTLSSYFFLLPHTFSSTHFFSCFSRVSRVSCLVSCHDFSKMSSFYRMERPIERNSNIDPTGIFINPLKISRKNFSVYSLISPPRLSVLSLSVSLSVCGCSSFMLKFHRKSAFRGKKTPKNPHLRNKT